MSQTVSSASKAAVSLAFHRARHKFPKNFGYVSTNVKPCHEQKHCNRQEIDNVNDLRKAETIEKSIENSISTEKIQDKKDTDNKDNFDNSNLTSREFECAMQYNDTTQRKQTCKEKDKSYSDESSSKNSKNVCPIHNVKPICIHHCNKCHHNDFTRKLNEWEYKIQKEATLKPRKRLHRTKTVSCIKNVNHVKPLKAELEQTCSFHDNHYLNYHRYHRHHCQSKMKLSNAQWDKRSVGRKFHCRKNAKKNTVASISKVESQSDITDDNKLKHKDSVLILLEKLSISNSM